MDCLSLCKKVCKRTNSTTISFRCGDFRVETDGQEVFIQQGNKRYYGVKNRIELLNLFFCYAFGLKLS